MSSRRVGILGGGLAGLAAARELALRGTDFVLLEAANWLGGQIKTTVGDGFLVEEGAEGLPLQSTDCKALIAETGLIGRLVSQQQSVSLLQSGTSLVPLPPGESARILDLQVDPDARGRGIVSFRSGMSELVDALVRTLPDDSSRTDAAVASVERSPVGYRIGIEQGLAWQVEALIVALPPAEAARLLRDLDPAAADLCAGVPTVSSVTVSLAFPRASVAHPLDATGFVVDEQRERPGLKACTFTSSKFQERAPEGWVLLRAFYRPEPGALDRSDEEWTERARGDLWEVLGLRDEPRHSWVTRWDGAICRANPATRVLLGDAARRLHEGHAIELAGAALTGTGVQAALLSGRAAGRRALARFPSAFLDHGAS